jgi:hypothetical protein
VCSECPSDTDMHPTARQPWGFFALGTTLAAAFCPTG